jgi:hypothetical protein
MHARTRTHTHTYTCTHVRVHTHIPHARTYVYTHMHARTHTHTQTHTHTHTIYWALIPSLNESMPMEHRVLAISHTYVHRFALSSYSSYTILLLLLYGYNHFLFSSSFLYFSSYSPTASDKPYVVPSLTTFFHGFCLQTDIIHSPSKTRYWRKDKGRDAKQGEVSSYQMTLRKRDDTRISKKHQQIALSGELALERDHGNVVPKTTQDMNLQPHILSLLRLWMQLNGRQPRSYWYLPQASGNCWRGSTGCR